jgi:uncharacterized protein (TIGR04255 family)
MSDDTSQAKNLPSYKKPPLMEVACGVRFDPIPEFKAPHSGLLWARLGDEFSKCEHVAPLGLAPETLMNAQGLPLPRIWFLNESGNNIIQLQNDRFHFNWRKRSEEEEYPRFNAVLSPFQKNFGILAEFIKEHNLGQFKPVECELLYINLIPKGEGWESVADIHNIFPDLVWRSSKGRFLQEPLRMGWQTSFALPEDRGILQVNLQQAERKLDKLSIFRLELVARGLGEDKSSEAIWQWFQLAHEWIVSGFADLIDTKIQKEIWGREDL